MLGWQYLNNRRIRRVFRSLDDGSNNEAIKQIKSRISYKPLSNEPIQLGSYQVLSNVPRRRVNYCSANNPALRYHSLICLMASLLEPSSRLLNTRLIRRLLRYCHPSMLAD
jgi:hypothetical protein